MLPQKMLTKALEIYRQEVPFIGTITNDKAEDLLKEGKICRGWMLGPSGLEYFHIIKSPSKFPELSILVSDSEENLFFSTVMLGQQKDVDLDKLFK